MKGEKLENHQNQLSNKIKTGVLALLFLLLYSFADRICFRLFTGIYFHIATYLETITNTTDSLRIIRGVNSLSVDILLFTSVAALYRTRSVNAKPLVLIDLPHLLRPKKYKGIIICVVTGLLVALVGIVYFRFLFEYHFSGGFILSGKWAWLVFSLQCFISPFTEELVYRGISYSLLSHSFGSHIASVVVTVAFISLHFIENSLTVATLLQITAISIGTMYARVKYDSLLHPIALHLSYNSIICWGFINLAVLP